MNKMKTGSVSFEILINDSKITICGNSVDDLISVIERFNDDKLTYFFMDSLNAEFKEKHLKRLDQLVICRYLNKQNILNKYCWIRCNKSTKGFTKFENAIIEAKQPTAIYILASNIKNGNIKKEEEAIKALKDAKSIFMFAKCVKDANIQELQNAIIETKDKFYMIKFLNEINGVGTDYKTLKRAIDSLK